MNVRSFDRGDFRPRLGQPAEIPDRSLGLGDVAGMCPQDRTARSMKSRANPAKEKSGSEVTAHNFYVMIL